MLINFVLPSIGTSGGIDVVYKYVELLKKQGNNVCVYKEICATNMHRYKSRVINIVHKIYCTVKAVLQKEKFRHDEDRFVWKVTDKTVRNADITIATAWPTAYKVNKLSKSKGKKIYFIQGYEVYDNAELASESYLLPLNKIVVSTWINDCLKRDLNIGPFPVIYNGIDTNIYKHINAKKSQKEISILMLNHTLSIKGVDNGLEVYREVKREYPQCKLRMFGMCDKSNLPDFVDEYYQNPSKRKLVELYSMSDIFIFPSLAEGWGLTPIEAMACGCIVVGTKTGFVLDLGMNRKNMMISEPGDISAMVDNMLELINDCKLQESIRNEMKFCIQHLDWNNSLYRFEKIIKSLL